MEKMRRFFQTSYAAASWSKPRKVVARVEAREQGSDIRFIVTNLPGRAKVLYEKVYCARGRMENLIKDMKLPAKGDPLEAIDRLVAMGELSRRYRGGGADTGGDEEE